MDWQDAQTRMCYLMYARCSYEDKNGREKPIMQSWKTFIILKWFPVVIIHVNTFRQIYLGLTLWSQKTLSFKIYHKNSVDKLNVWLFGSLIPPFFVSFNPLWLPVMVLDAGGSKNGLCLF